MKLNRERKTTAGVADSLRYSLHRLIQNEAKSCLVRLRDINILSQVEFFFLLEIYTNSHLGVVLLINS